MSQFESQLRIAGERYLNESLATEVLYEIIFAVNGLGVIRGFSIDCLGSSSPKFGKYQIVLKGNFDGESLERIQPIIDEHDLQINVRNNSVLISRS